MFPGIHDSRLMKKKGSFYYGWKSNEKLGHLSGKGQWGGDKGKYW